MFFNYGMGAFVIGMGQISCFFSSEFLCLCVLLVPVNMINKFQPATEFEKNQTSVT